MAINFLYPTNTRPEIQINDTDDNPRLAFLESDVVSGGISTTGGNLVFETSSGTERARIDSVGRLMVNTTSPFANAAITVVGLSGTNVSAVIKSTDNQAWLSVQDDASGTYGALFGTDSDAGLDIILADSSATNRLVIDTSGKVGIGTDNPDRKLHVKDSTIVVSEFEGTNTGSLMDLVNSNASQLYNGIRFTQGTSSKMAITHIADGTTKGYIQIGNSWAAGSEILVVDGRTSKVGIGTASPAGKLHVSDNGSDTNILISNTGSGQATVGLDASNGDFSGSDYMVLRQNNDLSGDITMFQSAGNFHLRSQISGAIVSALTMQRSTGNIGIGTDTPKQQLHVSGGTTAGDVTKMVIGATGGNAESYLYLAELFSGDNVNYGFAFVADGNSSNNLLFKRHSNSTSGTTVMEIRRDSDQIRFNGYSGTNQTGTPTYLLGTDGSGNIIKTNTVPGSAAGPYLPLAGGTMTGTIVGPTAGNSSANLPALEVVASGTANTQASIAIQQKTSEGDTIIYADYEPHVEWGISTENGANLIHFTGGTSTGGMGSKTFYNNSGNARTAYIKFEHDTTNGNTKVGGTFSVASSSTFAAISATNGIFTGYVSAPTIYAENFYVTSSGTNVVNRIDNDGNKLYITYGNATNRALEIANNNGDATFAGNITVSGTSSSFNTGSSGTFVTNDASNYARFTVNNGSAQLGLFRAGNNAGGMYIGGAADGFRLYTAGFAQKLLVDQSGNATFAGQVLATEYNLPSGGMLDWANGDARIVEGLVNNYSLSFQTYDGSALNTALRLDGNNTATFAGKAYGVTPIPTDLDTMLATKKYVDDSITGGANYLGVWDPDDSLNNGYGNPSLQASGRTDDSGDYFICSADGAAHPNGGTSEPDSWHVGDWVIWNEDLGTSGLWQKLDNTTVLSGGGTTNSIAKFTDNETIGDSLLKDTGKLTYTTSQSALMDLKGTSPSGYAELNIKNNLDNSIVIGSIGSTYGSADWSGSTYLYNSGTGRKMYIKSISDMQFFTGGYSVATDIRMTISSGGSVGIGTVTPAAGLQVSKGGSTIPAAGSSTASAVFGNSTSDNNYGLAVGAISSGAGYIQSQRTDGTATTYNLAIQPNGGNVSIGGGAIGNPGGDKLQVDGTLRVGPYFAVSDRDFIKLVPHGTDTRIISPNERFHIENASGHIIITPSSTGGVGIGTEAPEAKLDVTNGTGKFCVDSKTHALTNAFTTCLTVNLNSHTGCYVTLTCFGDWGSHSSAAYRGEFFLQNGANSYNEPGIILRQDDNTSNGTDQIVCRLLDPTGTGNPKDFAIQIRTTATSGTTGFTGQLTYTVQGKFNSIT